MSKAASSIPAKQKILNAALNVIRCKGYSATTVDDLCAAAGVTKDAFFHHFKTKEDLGVAAARHWSAVTSELFAQALYHKLKDPLDRLLGYIDFRRTILQGEVAEYTCLVGTMVQETFESNPAIREACGYTYLEVVPSQKIVVTDAYTKAWQPLEKPFMTAIITFEDEGGKTKYTARALHWNEADGEQHEEMGFHEGWGQCADQLEESASKL